MSKAIRVIPIEKGIDVRRFVLFSFGGAGGMHAAEIASGLQIPKVLIPKNAGVFSSLGLLLADSIKDYSKTVLETVDSSSIDNVLQREFIELMKKALYDMKLEGFSREQIELEQYLDLRYYGQSFEITVPYTENTDYLDAFHRIHEQTYSYSHPDRSVEIVNLRVKAVGKSSKVEIKKSSKAETILEKAVLQKQNIYYKQKQEKAFIYERSFLKPGNMIFGPALIVDYESTAFVPTDFKAEIDRYLNIVMSKKENKDD
jgi:N-methylhydantoinase A/oxoprolinase/acetone carboxylase beta subunit